MADDASTTPAEETATVAEAPQPEDTDLGEAGKKALAAERAAKKAAERQLADLSKRLQEFEDRDKTEAQKLIERAEAAEKAAAEATANLKRNQIALRHGLTEDEAQDMNWSGTDEEIEARAKRVSERRPVATSAPRGAVDQGVRPTPSETPDINTLLKIAARGGNPM